MAQPIVQTLRTYHRWISTAAMVLLTWVAVTGVALALDVLFQPKMPPPPPPPKPLSGEALGGLAKASLAAAYAKTPDARPTQVEVTLSTRQGEALGEVRLGPPASEPGARGPDRFVFDRATGAARAAPPEPQRAGLSDYIKFRIALHKLLERLHRGNIIGWSGQLLSVLTGFSFVFLTVSGVWMYVDMLIRRRRMGKRQLFWS